jgi:Holliday junction resolvase RusA-like endonuclease
MKAALVREQFTIPGHCYSLKNSRQIEGRRKDRKRKGKFILGKTKRLSTYMDKAVLLFRSGHEGKPWRGPVGIKIEVFYRGPRPDELGPAETLFDCLERAGVVQSDGQLHLYGDPAIKRIHAKPGEARVRVLVWKMRDA